MAIFEDFIEIILRIRCTRTLHTVCHKFSLKYFHKRLKIREIFTKLKTREILALYGRCMNIYKVHLSPALNGSSVIGASKAAMRSKYVTE